MSLGAEPPLSVTLLAEGPAGLRLTFAIEDLDGRALVDPARPERSPNRALPGRGLALAQLPVASAALPLAAGYRYAVRAASSVPPAPDARAVTTLFVKRAPAGTAAVPAVQELPVTVYLVEVAAVDEERLGAALLRAADIWRPAGIVVRPQRPERLSGAGLGRLAIDPALGSDTPALGRLLARSGGGRGEAGLPIFFVRELGTSGGSGIWALSGGIPAAPIPGTARSGVVVSAALAAQDPRRAGQVLAHEIGHALGLYHTTEAVFLASPSGDLAPVHDGLDDTPRCPGDADVDPLNARLEPHECGAFDAGNLMFWAPRPEATAISAAQAEIARRSPLTR